jgi:hypothetical protein
VTEREEIQMALVRVLSTGGLILSGISPSDQRERIRVAIMERGIKDKRFDANLTFGEAFGICFPGTRALELRSRPRDASGRPLEKRASRRDELGRPAHDLGADPLYGEGPGDDEDDGDGSEDEG